MRWDAAAAGALVIGVICVYAAIGLPPALIIGVPGVLTFLLWHRTYLPRPTDPAIIMPLFLITVAGFEVHLIEEYLGHYAPAISRLFDIGWTDQSFAVISFALAAALALTAVGLYYRKPFAGFVAYLFLATRLAELGLFVFPLRQPALEPDDAASISRAVGSGTFVADMPNHYVQTTGTYYFPGMFTVALVIVPATYTLYRLWRARPGRPA